jgi:flagellar M-ring protein FliF
MRDQIIGRLQSLQRSFASFTSGQKTIAVIGGLALVLGAVMVFRWASTPSYAPLFTNMAAADASAVVDKLNSAGTPYQLTDGGTTVLVPQSDVYDARIQLSGEGLPSQSSDGYGILDKQNLSTSQFQEQTSFKRAMEGELAKTIEAIDGVDTAVVHLALPPAKVFADQQDPPTASVLIDTSAGTTFAPEQVQAVIHLVASSIDGLSPDKVTVADAQGRVLSSPDSSGGLGASTRDQQIADFQDQRSARIQTMLDRVLGPGNSIVQVTADLDFDKSVSESTTYDKSPGKTPLSAASSSETYQGPAGASGSTGVVGPDGQMDPTSTTTTTGGSSNYIKKSSTEDNPVGTVVEHRETAPGGVNSVHYGIAMDTAASRLIGANTLRRLIAATVGFDKKRGDTLDVSAMPFDRTADKAAAAELAKAAAAEKKAQQMDLMKKAGIALGILAILLLAWLRGRKRNQARENATTYIVEQLRSDAAQRTAVAPALEPSPALSALEASEAASNDVRAQLATLVERQPEDVASLLRGWLVEPK